MKIESPQILIPGMEARPLSNGFVAVGLHYSADPIGLPPELLEEHARELGGRQHWRWRKEMELDFLAQSGQPVFEQLWLSRQHPANPAMLMDVDESGRLVPRPHGRVRVWIDPKARPESLPSGAESGLLTFALGMDVGAGTGKSDSTIVGLSVEGRRQAVEFRSNTVLPTDLGRVAVAVARYFNDALIVCPQKMHGLTAIRAMCETGYSLIWRKTLTSKIVETSTDALGWPYGEMSSSLLVNGLRDALERGSLTLHGIDTLEQLRQYVYDAAGRAVLGKLAADNPAARLQHGDLVVGLALAVRGAADRPKYASLVYSQPPQNSFEARRRAWEKQRAEELEEAA